MLSELRLLSSMHFDSKIILSVVLAGDVCVSRARASFQNAVRGKVCNHQARQRRNVPSRTPNSARSRSLVFGFSSG